MTSTSGLSAAEQKRLVNEMLRDFVEVESPEEPIAFFCECDRDCCRLVWLTPAQYDAVRRNPAWEALAAHPAGVVPLV